MGGKRGGGGKKGKMKSVNLRVLVTKGERGNREKGGRWRHLFHSLRYREGGKEKRVERRKKGVKDNCN